MKRTLLLTCCVAVLVGAAPAACSSTSKPVARPAPTISGAVADSGGPRTPPTPGPTASNAEPSTSPSQSARCHVDELKMSVQSAAGGGAAGSMYSLLVFTNVSGRTCTLWGHPGVSWAKGPAGPQVNDAFRRNAGGTPDRVVLAPDGAAHALIQLGHPEAFEPQCHAVDVYGVRVYPPDETNSVVVPWATTTCSVNGVDVGIIYPIAVGPSN
jgi:hypothetical protein